ncbi:polyprenyl synthetase family protein, partial [Streptomyces sp. NPDC002454]
MTRTGPEPGNGADTLAAPAVPCPAPPPTGADDEASALLEGARADVDPELRRAVDAMPGPLRRVARYHFGWERADGTPATGNA